LQSQAKNQGSGETTFKTESGLSGVFGVNIRNINGEARVEPFGNMVRSEKGASVEATREPLTDLLEEDTGYTVIVELPGVDANSIMVNLDGLTLRIEAGTGIRKYQKVLQLDKAVQPEGMKRSYQNGILELNIAFA
jgi:HSP20 family protein